ncbi:hypothetical protein NQ314_000704 [Rhamnusium bicolor]|uniref:WD repeat-containing and planar cell polarity effector protein fritz n=1 Tax=Rhamnusium bicolor TaxID=1586634 RepID=A0AAV8ZUA9_9CUCU|nr:hypothetical protein NQ314_000704 [Rhamnusium bicolor]
MITLLSEVHFWTTQEDVLIKHTDYGSFKYYTKKDSNDSLGAHSKKQYCEQRGLLWNPINKRPQKLRDRLKELEEYLIHNKIVFFSWDENKLKFLLSTGLIVNITINSKTGDINNIIFDKQLSAKLQVNIICDGTIVENHIICICNDGHVLGFGGQWKDGWVLEGGPRRKLNYHGDWLAVWGKVGSEHPQPWSPLAKDHQRANLHLYWIGARDPELLAYKKTDGEPLQVVVSKTCSRAVSVEVNSFELVGNNLKRISVTSVPLQTQVSCSSLNDCEDRLLICCIDGSLALLDRNRGSTRTVKAAFMPSLTVWHPQGALVAISNERGQLQYYDTALNCIKSQIIGEDCTPAAIIDLSIHFSMQFSVASIKWGPKDLILSLEQGPLVVITHVEKSLTFKSIIQKFLSMGKVEKAIKLLLSWDFNEESFYALQRIVAYLMRQPLTEENAQHLQNALGSFHNSPIPLRPQMKHRYGSQLVRANMFETAFLLAVDVGHHDLFMDLHYIAVTIGETEMAAAARAQASALLSRCSSEEQPNVITIKTSDYVPPLPLNSDNYLTTNFNQPLLTTYKTTTEKENISTTSHVSEYPKLNYTPRATYVKSPQVPSNFTKVNLLSNSNIIAPPLPFTPPLPNLPNNSLGIPYRQNSTTFNSNVQNSAGFAYTQTTNASMSFLPHKNFYNSTISARSFLSGSMTNITLNSPKVPQNSMLYSAFSSSNLAVNNIKKSFTPISKVLPPPLPNLPNVIPTNSHIESVVLSSNLNQGYVNSSGALETASTSTSGKKHQPKVKFSDTVTAFIVPEIKRPQRPPPPPHVTDPQKELADSLPLCHPNEDYLKDFTPVRKDDNQDSEGGQQPKIKVVHFGVV